MSPLAQELLHRARLAAKVFATFPMIELEVYATSVRDLNKILELETVSGSGCKVDSNHDFVYLDLGEPTIIFEEIQALFLKFELEPRFVGAIAPELRPRSKTPLVST
jgi:hypothetical protein